MKTFLKPLALCVALLAGCGGGGDDGKELFSVWTRSDTAATIDLSQGQFGTQSPFLTIDKDGSQCNCNLLVVGEQGQGSIALNSCYYVQGSSQKDPGCSARNSAATYTNAGGVLTITGSAGAATFR